MSCIMQTPIFCSSCDLCIFCLALLQLATRQLNYDLKKKKVKKSTLFARVNILTCLSYMKIYVVLKTL